MGTVSKKKSKAAQRQRLQVWWIPQVPMKPFTADVESVAQAKFLLEVLANYDLFQYENHVKPDYSNAGGLNEFDPDDKEDGPDGSWTTWYSQDGDDIDELTMDQCREIDAAK
jgi:1,2-phenylacetyl-CoA epoxidase catalytic subunit